MKAVSPLQVAAAVETMRAAGWTMAQPAPERLRLIRVATVADLLDCSEDRARAIVHALPNSVRLPGDDLRARVADLEEWMAQRRLPKPADVSLEGRQ